MTAEILSSSEELAGNSSTRGNTQPLNPGLKRKRRRFLPLSQNQKAGGDENGSIQVGKRRKMPKYYPTEDVPLKLPSHVPLKLQSASKKTEPASLPGPSDHPHWALQRQEGGFSEAAELLVTRPLVFKQVPLYRTHQKLSLPPPQKLISAM